MPASSVDSSMAQSDHKHYNKHNYSHYVKEKKINAYIKQKSKHEPFHLILNPFTARVIDGVL